MSVTNIEHFLRSLVRTITVVTVVFISYGGIGVLADIRAGVVVADETVFDHVEFFHPFQSVGVLHEANAPESSSSPYFWLISGGIMQQAGGVGQTIQGSLDEGDKYYKEYARYSPEASDNGQHPQNDFRMLTKRAWTNLRQEITVTIKEHNLENPDNRHAWNAFDLVSRYQDTATFYFASLRVDGKATIKKYYGGRAYTLATATYTTGTYNSSQGSSLLPENVPLRLALETETNADGSVRLRLYTDKTNGGQWQLMTQATDTGENTGGQAITAAGRGGFYSDFMDISLDDYRVLSKSGGTAIVQPPQDGDVPDASYGLSSVLTLQETGSLSASPSSQWWLNSGAYFNVESNIGKTAQGELPSGDPWRMLYAQSNPRDTDDGYHPQNIFRLLTKQTWEDVEQKAYFNIRGYNLSASELRAAHNGFLFFNRYKDQNNLYYTGIRVDGKAIIKKKVGGTYYTLASGTVFSGTYNRSSNPNLIPEDTWIGIKSVVRDNADGSVRIQVYADTANNGTWKLVAEVTDTGATHGAVITGKAAAGIRTDYMDVWFKEYSIKEL